MMKVDWRSVGWGFIGTLIAALLVGLCLIGYVTWNRAIQGKAAFDYIQQVIMEQQKQQQQNKPK